jgi:hypothetical protein
MNESKLNSLVNNVVHAAEDADGQPLYDDVMRLIVGAIEERRDALTKMAERMDACPFRLEYQDEINRIYAQADELGYVAREITHG